MRFFGFQICPFLLVIAMSAVNLKSVLAEQQRPQDFGLPVLHRISAATLGPAYSCRPPEEFQKGYENTALFLSKWSQQRNSPELLFNGACGSEDFFQSSTAGDDMNLIADLGEARLEDLSAHKIFGRDIHFTSTIKVGLNHTYAVLINRAEVRALFVFTVVAHTQNNKLDIQYAVKEYQVINVRALSPGFVWEGGNW